MLYLDMYLLCNDNKKNKMHYPCPEYTSAALMLNALEGGGVEWDCEFAQNQKIPDASATDALGQVPTSFTMFKITLVGINLPPCQ